MKGLFSNTNSKLFKYIIIAIVAVFGLLIIIFILSLFKSKRLSINDLENELKNAAISYYKVHEDELPKLEGSRSSISDTALSEANKMKKMSEISPDGYSCSGNVIVQKNGEYYMYIPYLDCGEKYKTTSLIEKIKSNNPMVVQGDGLYAINDDLVFRGEYVDNFVTFSGITWRIIKIEEDNSLRLVETDKIKYTSEVWDDRYNINKDGTVGINDFELSRLKLGLKRIYENQENFSENSKEKILFKKLCIGARNVEETNNSGDVECSVKSEDAMPVGLMITNDYLLASIDKNCKHTYDESCNNYNYMTTLAKSTWTLTPDSSNTHKAYKLSGNSNSPYSVYNCSSNSGLRMVIYISGDMNYISGSGTESDPYIVK